MKRRYLLLLLILASTACASGGSYGDAPRVVIYPDGAYTVTCVDGHCISRKRPHTHTKSCDHDD